MIILFNEYLKYYVLQLDVHALTAHSIQPVTQSIIAVVILVSMENIVKQVRIECIYMCYTRSEIRIHYQLVLYKWGFSKRCNLVHIRPFPYSISGEWFIYVLGIDNSTRYVGIHF